MAGYIHKLLICALIKMFTVSSILPMQMITETSSQIWVKVSMQPLVALPHTQVFII